jgi:hypothetical protein
MRKSKQAKQLRAWRDVDLGAIVTEPVPVSKIPWDDDPELDLAAFLSDDEISQALLEEPLLLFAAKFLAKVHGRLPARLLPHASWLAHTSRPFIAQASGSTTRLCSPSANRFSPKPRQNASARRSAMRHERNHGPRCGARTRSGRPCRRKVVLGKRRCPNHGGLSTGPKTPEGKSRSRAALQRGRERARKQRAT